MDDAQKALKDLQDIKQIMEESTKFISLSGFSGVFSGIYALIGGGYLLTTYQNVFNSRIYGGRTYVEQGTETEMIINLMIVGVAMLVASFTTGIFLTVRKAKKRGESVFGKQSQQLLTALFIPLVAGGLFTLILMLNGYFELLAPATLIFYGLALINASKYTLHDIKYLGIVEIMLSLVCLFAGKLDILVWMFGFGVMHIIYGLIMYFKYERK